VLADEVMDLGPVAVRLVAVRPPVVEILLVLCTPFLERGHITDRSVEPDVPVVPRAVGNLETEIGRRTRYVPIVQRLAEEVALQVIGDLGLQMLTALRPLFEKRMQSLDLYEQVFRAADLGLRSRK